MAKIPDKPQEIFILLLQDYLKVFGNELVSLYVYGSAASGSYIKGKSDINTLLVITTEGMDRFTGALATIKYWQKRRVAVPLVLTKVFIDSSLDCYPIEFMNMKNNNILIYGEDILTQIKIEATNLRLQIERELKGKLILLRQGYLEAQGKPRQLKNLIGRSFTAIISIFNALLYYKHSSAPKERQETIKEISKVFKIDAETFLQCADIREERSNLSGEEIAGLFKRYVQEVANMCNIIDSL
jgi:predicted nucleotidyltransferase